MKKNPAFDALCPNSIIHASFRTDWPFHTLYRAPSACVAASAIEHISQVLVQLGDRTALRYHLGRFGSRYHVFCTGSRLSIILGACKLRSETDCPRQRETIRKEITATGAIPGCMLPAPSLKMNRVTDESLRADYSSRHCRRIRSDSPVDASISGDLTPSS